MTWSGFSGSKVKVHVYKSDRYVRRVGSPYTHNDGSTQWTVPKLTPGDDYKIRVISASDSSESVFSKFTFTVQ